jgi:hypothetical protein
MDSDIYNRGFVQGPNQVAHESAFLMIRVAAGIIIGGLVVGPTTYMLVDREPPHFRYGGKIEPHEVRAGDTAIVTWNIQTNRKCEEWKGGEGVERQIIDSSGKITTMEPTAAVAGNTGSSTEVIVRQIIIPMGLTYGHARYRSIARFKCNWTQRWFPIEIKTPEIPFIVLPQ